MAKPTKLAIDELKKGMQVFLNFPEVETEVEQVKEERIATATAIIDKVNDRRQLDMVDKIMTLLDVRTSKEYQERLKLLIAATTGSIEVMGRVCTVICPCQTTWNERRKSEAARRKIAQFLANPDSAPDVPWYVRERLRLPKDFFDRDRVASNIAPEMHKSLQSLYNTRSGLAVENVINDIVTQSMYGHEKGQVSLVDNKEVDVAVPGLTLPRILIMASYQLTTASSQSQRAREQQTMYDHVGAYNNRRDNRGKPNVQLVNVIDGGGWLARPKDLAEMHRYCDYAMAVGHLADHLPPVLHYHMQR